MNRIKRAAAAILALFAAVSFSGCATYENFHAAFFEQVPEGIKPYKIGVYEPLTGIDAAEASEEVKGIELAHSLYPRVLDQPVELVYADNQSDVEIAKTAAKQLIADGVNMVLGSYKSTLSLVASDIFEEVPTPAIGITCTNPLVTQTNEFYFRVCFIDAFQGISAAKYIYNHLERTEAVAFKQSGDDYAASMIEQFQIQMEKLTGRKDCVSVVEYPEGTEDFTTYLAAIRVTGAKSVFFPSTPQTGDKVLAQAVNMGLEWIGSSKWEGIAKVNTNPLVNSMDYLQGAVFVKGFDAAGSVTPMTEVFKKAYQEKYGKDAVPSEACALGFDAYLVALEAIKKAEGSSDGVTLTSKLKAITNLEGATGYITMNAQGDPIKDVIIEKITAEGGAVVYTVAP